MRRLLLTILLLAAPCMKAQQAKDFYQGIVAVPCPNQAITSWNIQRINKHVVLCTPIDVNNAVSHAMILMVVDNVTGDTHSEANHVPQTLNTTTTAKYASPLRDVGDVRYQMMLFWDFNAGGVGSFRHATDSQIQAANKVPFIEYGAGGSTGASNGFQHCINGADGVRQCKNLWNLTTANYDGSTSHNLADVFDPAYTAYENNEFANDSTIATWKNSNFYIGFVSHDPDNLSGYNGAAPGAGQAADTNHGGTIVPHPWDTDQAGSSWSSPMLRIAASAPYQASNPRNANAVFADQLNYTKQNYCQFLQTRYTTAAAWNAAWGTGTFYTGFGTDGTQVTGATTSGSGSGPYTATLHVNVDNFSVLVLVSGVGIGGDGQGHGTIQGTNISSATINYATGAISITFTGTPAAPPTVNYHWGGWGIGTQCMDEAGAHNGNADTTGAPGASAAQIRAQVQDWEDYLAVYTNKLATVMKNAFKAQAPNKLFFASPGTPLRDPPRCGIIKGWGQVVDVLGIYMSNAQDQANFVSQCGGDVAYFIWESVLAQNDWDMYNCPGGTGCGGPSNWPPVPSYNYSNQNTRGAGYAAEMAKYWSQCNQNNGNCNFLGIGYWSYYSIGFPEYENWGLCSWRDNCYNGHDNVTTIVTCAAPLQAYTCGSEQTGWSAYGNFLGPVTTANQAMDGNVASLGNSLAATPTASPVAGTYATTQNVTLSTTSPGAVICWNTTGNPSTNGGSGCNNGMLYSGTISVSVSETIFPVAGGASYTDSPIASFAYAIVPVPSPPPPPSSVGVPPLIIMTQALIEPCVPDEE